MPIPSPEGTPCLELLEVFSEETEENVEVPGGADGSVDEVTAGPARLTFSQASCSGQDLAVLATAARHLHHHVQDPALPAHRFTEQMRCRRHIAAKSRHRARGRIALGSRARDENRPRRVPRIRCRNDEGLLAVRPLTCSFRSGRGGTRTPDICLVRAAL